MTLFCSVPLSHFLQDFWTRRIKAHQSFSIVLDISKCSFYINKKFNLPGAMSCISFKGFYKSILKTKLLVQPTVQKSKAFIFEILRARKQTCRPPAVRLTVGSPIYVSKFQLQLNKSRTDARWRSIHSETTEDLLLNHLSCWLRHWTQFIQSVYWGTSWQLCCDRHGFCSFCNTLSVTAT